MENHFRGSRCPGFCRGFVLAPDLFLEPTDWIKNRTVHRGDLDLTVGDEIFTDLDFTDHVSLHRFQPACWKLVVVLAPEILHEDSS